MAPTRSGQRLSLLILCVGFLMVAAVPCLGADAPGPAGAGAAGPDLKALPNAISLTAGRLLPFDINGLTDIYPYWALRVGQRLGVQDVEFSGDFVHAKNVKLYTGAVALAFPSELEGFRFIPTVGLNMTYYSGYQDAPVRHLPFSLDLGVQFGFSPIFDITQSLGVRTNFMFGFNPGRTLYVDSGLQYSF